MLLTETSADVPQAAALWEAQSSGSLQSAIISGSSSSAKQGLKQFSENNLCNSQKASPYSSFEEDL